MSKLIQTIPILLTEHHPEMYQVGERMEKEISIPKTEGSNMVE